MSLLVIPIWELAQKSLIGLGLLAILDFCWAYHTKARYFALHGIWNIIIVVILWGDFWKTVWDPLGSMGLDTDPNRWPIVFIAMIHLWHCVAYGKLSWDDYFHHGVFAFFLCGVNLFWEWGYFTNFVAFFICGFPGGVDYFMLLAVKHEYIDKLTEKHYNRLLNVWCRGPGCIAASCLVWMNWVSGNLSHVPATVKIMSILLTAGNGQYYSRRVVASWAKYTSLTTNTNAPICSKCQLLID